LFQPVLMGKPREEAAQKHARRQHAGATN